MHIHMPRARYWIQQTTDAEFHKFTSNDDGYFIDSMLDIDLEVEPGDTILVYIQNSGFIGFGKVLIMARHYEMDFHFVKSIGIRLRNGDKGRLHLCEDERIICHVNPRYNFDKWIQEKSNYWAYVINRKRLNEFVKHGETHLGSYSRAQIDYEDIIIMIIRDQRISRFYGLYKVAKPCLRNETKVFTDNNLNRYLVPIKTFHVFAEPIKLQVIDRIRSQATGLKNSDNFRRRHMVEEMTFSLVHKDVLKLVSEILEEELRIEQVQEMDTDELMAAYSDDESVTTSEYEDDTANTPDGESDDEESDEEVNNGKIPVMITPCNNFVLPDVHPEKYLMDHLIECNSCVITDNNKFCVSAIFDKAVVEIVDVIEGNNAYYHLPLEDYWAMKGHEPLAPRSKYFIRAAHVLDASDLYYDCFLLTWTCTGDDEG